MKKFYFLCCGFIFSFQLIFHKISLGQTSGSNWVVSGVSPKNFIENKSQFNGKDKLTDSKILFGVDDNGAQIYFTKQGLTFRFDEKEKAPTLKGEGEDR